MSTSYSREITVSATAGAAYRALTTEFNKWWTEDCQSVSRIGDRIAFRFGRTRWVMRADKLVPGHAVELVCVAAHHVHDGLPSSIQSEWEGTRLTWTIEPRGERTRVAFVHHGLVPSLACYEVCERGWDHFFVDSLKRYLDSGEGIPFVSRDDQDR